MTEFLTTHDAAKILGVHPYTVGRQVDLGVLKATRTAGGHRRIAAAELRRYLVEHEMEIPAELTSRATRIRLLVVDAKLLALEAVGRAFKPFAGEFEITATTSAIEALLIVGATKPDALLIDVSIADPFGFEICRRVTRSKSLVGVKVVTMTSVHRSDIIGSSLTAGAHGCLKKPIEPKELLVLLAGR
jgi:excisionase family DNA binding protein